MKYSRPCTFRLRQPARPTALEIWNQVPSFLSQFQNRTVRVEGMDRDMKKFQERTSALLEQLDEPGPGWAPTRL